MPSKITKLYKKAKKGLSNIVSKKKPPKPLKTTPKVAEPNKLPELSKTTPKVEKPTEIQAKKGPEEKGLKRGISFRNSLRNSFKKAKEKIRNSKKAGPKIGGMFKNGFKKIKEKIKGLNPKKNKIIGSKKLALLLTAGTIVAILPTFNIAPFPALAITSACVFSINIIIVKTLKKAIEQQKAKTVAESEEPQEELQDVMVEPANKQNSKESNTDLK